MCSQGLAWWKMIMGQWVILLSTREITDHQWLLPMGPSPGLLITQKIASSTHWNPLGHIGIPCKGSPGTPCHHDQLKYAISQVLIKLQKTFGYRWNWAENIYWLMLPIKATIAKHTIAVCVQQLFVFLLWAVIFRDPLTVAWDPLKIWWRGPWDPIDFQPSRSPESFTFWSVVSKKDITNLCKTLTGTKYNKALETPTTINPN